MYTRTFNVVIAKSLFDIFFMMFPIVFVILIIIAPSPVMYYVCIPLLILNVLALLRIMLFRVRVCDSKISVRTTFGKKYSFEVSDIQRVSWDICYGPNHSKFGMITIETFTKKLKIETTMRGSEEMAEYILQNVKTGTINSEAISKYSMGELIKHAKHLINQEGFIFNEEGAMENLPEGEIEKIQKRNNLIIFNIIIWFFLFFAIMIFLNYCIYGEFSWNQTPHSFSIVSSLIISTLLIILYNKLRKHKIL